MAKGSDWTFIGAFDMTEGESESEDGLTEKDMLTIEKKRYKYSVSQAIKALEKEIKEGKLQDDLPVDFLDGLREEKLNHRNLRIDYEGEVYPKDIQPAVIVLHPNYIPFPEPHVIVTDQSDADEEWYRLTSVIPHFAEEAYLTYEQGSWLASISSSVNCCENILRYELFRKLKNADPSKLQAALQDKGLTLGALINPKSQYKCLSLLGIQSFYNDLDYLNLVRVAIYHASAEKAEEVRRRGTMTVEQIGPITDDLVIPIVTYKVYDIMLKLIDNFYNKKKALEYWKEGVADWKRKRKLDVRGSKQPKESKRGKA
ncbi:MAG TPA: hypothetical protein VL944_02285 [Candidatus Acidoferrum sp.]|nr:hypothetical protein [Candidatus Acidoferrum sp.]